VRPFGLIVFDLDGTLLDATEDLRTAINETLGEMRPAFVPFTSEKVRSFVGEGAARLVARALEAAGVEAQASEVLGRFLRHYRNHLLDQTHLYAGIVESLDLLAPIPLAVLTNKPGDLSRELLSGLGVGDRFVRILGGGDTTARKPDPGGLQSLIREVGVSPETTLMVGDTAIDIQTGRAAGTRTAGVLYGFDAEGCRLEMPDYLVISPSGVGALGDGAS
jgi:phosphoglycolate phosphatase